MRRSSWRNALVLLGCAAIPSIPSGLWAQAGPLAPLGSFWVTPYLGLGFQAKYYDGVVRFSDGDVDLLSIGSASGLLFGAQVGYRFRKALTLHVNVATSSPDAQYVENGSLRPDVNLQTTQLEAGALYDLGTFPVAGKIAPILLGGGVSFTFHSVGRFVWDGRFVEPRTTSVGVHGLIGLDIPIAPKLSLRGPSAGLRCRWAACRY